MGRLSRNVKGSSIRQCSRELGISDTAIHNARKDGRLTSAFYDDGSVDIEAVRKAMNETADPTRGGPRYAGVTGVVQVAPTVSASPERSQAVDAEPPAEDSTTLVAAKIRTENIRAKRDQLALDKEMGQVADLAPMVRAMVDAMTTAKGEILALPDRLTPLVTPETNSVKVYDLIESEVKKVCADLQDKLTRLAKFRAPE